eukprot:symbB.v1.2.037103.t1/scaffold5195.1/size29912/4
MFTRAQLSPVPGASHTGKRCDSALSNRSTAVPTRPCSSLASRGPSRGPSRAGPSPSPVGGNIWREDAKWPVREGGLSSRPGTNGSLDLDLDLARRKLVEEVSSESQCQARKFADDILKSVEKTQNSIAESQAESFVTNGRRRALCEARSFLAAGCDFLYVRSSVDRTRKATAKFSSSSCSSFQEAFLAVTKFLEEALMKRVRAQFQVLRWTPAASMTCSA